MWELRAATVGQSELEHANVAFVQVVLKKLLKQRRLEYKAARLLFCTPFLSLSPSLP